MSRRGATTLSLAFLASVVVAWQLFWRDTDPAVPTQEPSDPTTSRVAEASSVGAVPEPAASGPEHAERPERAERVAVPASGRPSDPLTGPWLVRVVDRHTRKAIPRALIVSEAYRYHDLTEAEQKEHDRNQPQGLSGQEQNLLRFGKRYECDQRGEALVPRERAGTRLWVLTKHYGTRFVRDTEPAPVLLEVEPDFALRVQAIDDAGKPVANVSFALRLDDGEDDWVTMLEFRPTNDPTVQIARRFPTKLRELRESIAAGAKASLEVRAPLLQPRRTAFVPDPRADQFVRVPVAPHGRVRVTIRDGALAPGLVFLSDAGNQTRSGGLDAMPRQGVAEFPLVGLGKALQVDAWRADRTRIEHKLAGPTAPGELLDLDLR